MSFLHYFDRNNIVNQHLTSWHLALQAEQLFHDGQESRSGETYSLLLMPCLVVVTLGSSLGQWRPNRSPHNEGALDN